MAAGSTAFVVGASTSAVVVGVPRLRQLLTVDADEATDRRIDAESDPARLDAWTARALGTETIYDVFAD